MKDRGFRLLMLLLVSLLQIAGAQPSPMAPVAKPDAVGQQLQRSFIWAADGAEPVTKFVAFRRSLELEKSPAKATLHLFADARYMLWVNGNYITSGPCRFETVAPEYDSIEIASHLTKGRNTIVILALGNQGSAQSGKIRRHQPGITCRLDIGSSSILSKPADWKYSDRARYRPPLIDWANLTDRIDSRVEDGDWTQPGYDDHAWAQPVAVDGSQWGTLTARRTAMLRDTPVEWQAEKTQTLPCSLRAGEALPFKLDRFRQVYTVIDFTAEDGAEAELHFDYDSATLERMSGGDHGDGGITYHARAGRQTYVTSDTRGLSHGAISVRSGRITIHRLQLIERLYPFDVKGSFQCSDQMLNHLWSMCARSCQLLSEDAYVDCADRERVEWMDSDPPAYDITRTALAGAGTSHIDSRLYAALLRRTAYTIQPEGWVKAHTCSDRFDIHAKMEDRACDWVQGARRYYDSTGDLVLIREIWPMLTPQMDWFLQKRTPRGLVLAREWIVWGNPIGYVTCEGAGLNAFVYKALQDTAALGKALGEERAAARYAKAADDLARAFDRYLWDEKSGSYFSAYYPQETASMQENRSHQPKLQRQGDHLEPTLFSSLWAMDQGIVPTAKKTRVMSHLLEHRQDARRIMTYYYLFQQMYAAHSPELDLEVLKTVREKWAPMAASPLVASWEEFDGASKAHIYGMFPGYFLSAYVLGVRPEMPASRKHLLIEPRLADLTHASGTVMTEHGPVTVAWKKSGTGLDFTLQLPPSVTTSLSLPATPENRCLLNGKLQNSTGSGHLTLTLKGGFYEGTLR
jgi:alpha-L-rhamnosidase